MVLLDQVKYEISQYEGPMADLGASLGRADKEKRISEIEELMNEPNFWEDGKRSGELMKEMKAVKEALSEYDRLATAFDDLKVLVEMAEEESDDELASEAEG